MANLGALGRTILAGGIAAILSAAAYSEPLDCKKLKVSVQPEPPGYAAQCLGKVVRPKPLQGPAAPKVPLPANRARFKNHSSDLPLAHQTLQADHPTLDLESLGPPPPQPTPIHAIDHDRTAGTLWGIDAAFNLGIFSLGNGFFLPLVPVTGVTGDTITAMAFDPTDTTDAKVHVIATSGSPPTIANLYSVELGNGVAAHIGPITGNPAPAAIAAMGFDNFGQLFAHDLNLDAIVKIDKTTGAATLIGATGWDANFAQGMDFDPTENRLWLTVYLGFGEQRLAHANLATGTATVVDSASNVQLEYSIDGEQPAQKSAKFCNNFDAGNIDELCFMILTDKNHPLNPKRINIGRDAVPAGTGQITTFTGPPGPTYDIIDADGSYPVIAPGTVATATDGYTLRVSGPRPVQHWDATIIEVLPTHGVSENSVVHIGDSFTDVPQTSPYYPFIEGIYHQGVTGGCALNAFCPQLSVDRGQMAVFALAAKYPGLTPPACAPPNLFLDVPETHPFCPWIEELSRREITAGCGGVNFCPETPVTREQMTVFVLRTLGGAGFEPPACGTPVFADVPASSPFCRWVEESQRRGITVGCGGGNFCPGQHLPREQMAVFLDTTFFPIELPPTPGPTPTSSFVSGSVTRGGTGGGRGANVLGIAFLLVGFASAIGLPLALRRGAEAREPG